MSGTEAESRRIEIVHESLLSHWPRLMRWRTQDADGAQLRDQLRQAAQLWEQRERSEDFLWSGAAFREYEVWRESYPGGLTALEEEFARAMERVAERRRLRRRIASVAFVAAVLLVAASLGVLWRRGVAEARRATAAQLLALGQAALEQDPPAALALVTESLRLADTDEARRFAVEVLWAAPTVRVSPPGPAAPWPLEFSPDGAALGVGYWEGALRVFRDSGGAPLELDGFDDGISMLLFSPDGALAAGFQSPGSGRVRTWRTADWTPAWSLTLPTDSFALPESEDTMLLGEPTSGSGTQTITVTLSRWRASDGRSPLGSIPTETAPGIDATHSRIAWGLAGELLLQRLDSLGERPTLLGRHPEKFHFNNAPAFDPKDRFVAGADEGGNVILWSLRSPGRKVRHFVSPGGSGTFGPALSRDGTLLCLPRGQFTVVWRLEGVAGAGPIRLDNPSGTQMSWCDFHADRPLVVTGRENAAAFWELGEKIVRQLQHDGGSGLIAFSPDSRYLYSLGINDGRVIRFPLRGSVDETETLLDTQPKGWSWGLAVDPRHRFVIATTRDRVRRIPLDGSPATTLGGLQTPIPGATAATISGLHPSIPGATVDPTGRIVASSRSFNGPQADLTLLDLVTGERRELGSEVEGTVNGWLFDAHGNLVVTRGGKLQVIDTATGRSRTLIPSGAFLLGLSPDRRRAVTAVDGNATIVDLETGALRTPRWNLIVEKPAVNAYWLRPACALGPGDVAADVMDDGTTVRVGSLDSREPHLLYGAGKVSMVAISPDGRWIAAPSQKGISLWPMPDLDELPLHTLPREELLAKLESLTNIRAAADEAAPGGYRIEVDEPAWRGWREPAAW